jgi:hypothetical protein
MKNVKIREISAKVIEAAAEAKEPLAITSDNVVCGIVIPVPPQWIEDVVHRNLDRIAQSIEDGEKELANGAPLTILDDVLSETAQAPQRPPLRRVGIRDISAKVIAAAAARNESLAITSDHVLRGVLVPISPQWLQGVVDHNLGRLVHSIQAGERELAHGLPYTTLDQVIAPGGEAAAGEGKLERARQSVGDAAAAAAGSARALPGAAAAAASRVAKPAARAKSEVTGVAAAARDATRQRPAAMKAAVARAKNSAGTRH